MESEKIMIGKIRIHQPSQDRDHHGHENQAISSGIPVAVPGTESEKSEVHHPYEHGEKFHERNRKPLGVEINQTEKNGNEEQKGDTRQKP